MQLTGTRVLVTGASRGIGEATARAFHERGAALALVARGSAALEAVASSIGATTYPADLGDPAALTGLIGRIEADGPIDVLVNNAGMDVTRPLWEQTAEEVRAIVQLNLATPIELSRQAVAAMLGRGRGHVVNVSSLAGCVPVIGFSTYGASKAGLTQFTNTLDVDLRGTAVGTTTVEVGPVRTALLEGVMAYEPTRRSYSRYYRTGLFADVEAGALARAIVRAVEHDRAHVVLPRRSALSAWLPQLSRAIGRALTAGIRSQ